MSGSRRRPTPSPQYYAEGVALYLDGRYKQAVVELASARQEGGLLGQMAAYYQAMAHRALGIEALREGRFDEAESHFRQAARTIGKDADLASYLAALYARQRRYGECVDEMSCAAESSADDVAAWRKLAQAQWRAGQHEQARITLATALRKLGNRAELHIQMGLFWAAKEKFDEARKSFTSAVEADCTCADSHYYLALAASAQGDVIDAVRSFQRAFELRRDDLVVARQLAMAAAAAERQGHHFVLRLPEAAATPEGSEIRQLAAYITSEPEFLDACLSLPDSPIDGELFGMLAGVVQMALAAHGGYADLRYHSSRIFARLGRLDEAIEQADKAVRINPRYVRAFLHLADLHARAKKPLDAVENIERAVACGADWPDVHCLAGEILARFDMPAEAKEYFKRALQLKAGYRRAAETMSALAA